MPNPEEFMSQQTVENIYKKMKHSLVSSVVVTYETVTEEEKKVKVDIKGESGETILDNGELVVRCYKTQAELYDRNQIGKLVIHETFYLKEEFRGQGIAKRVYKREFDAYKKANFNQVYLVAESDGVIIWPRAPFNFNILDEDVEEELILYWREYLVEIIGITDHNVISDTIKNKNKIRLLKKELVLPENKESFSDWFKDKNPWGVLVPMYKNLDDLEVEVIEASGEDNAS